MSERLTEREELAQGRLDGTISLSEYDRRMSLLRSQEALARRYVDGDPGIVAGVNRVIDAIDQITNTALAEVREHRAREAAHRAALDTLVDGDGR